MPEKISFTFGYGNIEIRTLILQEIGTLFRYLQEIGTLFRYPGKQNKSEYG